MSDMFSALIDGAFSAFGASKQKDFNRQEARRQRDWQERMSNTAHQREVEDLISAGLNPLLSANTGATTPSGAKSESPNVAGKGVSAMQAGRLMRAQEKLAAASAGNQDSQAELNEAKTEVLAPAAGAGEAGGSLISTAKEAASKSEDFIQQKFDDYYDQRSGVKTQGKPLSPGSFNLQRRFPRASGPTQRQLPKSVRVHKIKSPGGGPPVKYYTLPGKDGKTTYSLDGIQFYKSLDAVKKAARKMKEKM